MPQFLEALQDKIKTVWQKHLIMWIVVKKLKLLFGQH